MKFTQNDDDLMINRGHISFAYTVYYWIYNE